MGENLLASEDGGRPLMRYRENTIHSFNTAAEAGASFVEFDVQVKYQPHNHSPSGQVQLRSARTCLVYDIFTEAGIV